MTKSMSSHGTEPIFIGSSDEEHLSCCKSLKIRFLSLKTDELIIKVTGILIIPLLFFLVFFFIWGICGSCIFPPSNFFSLFLLYVLSVYFGTLSEMIYLPDLFGMIVAGFICRNIPQLQISHTLDPDWSSLLRSLALVVILIRAGMGLDARALRKLSCGVLRLALSPCLVELATVAVVSKFLLGLSWMYALILGSVLGAVSPAVVVPCLLHLSSQGYGVDKGIPTLVIAASSIDDVFAISLFAVFLGFAFDTGNMLYVALKSPLELLVGVVYGGVLAVVLWFIPHHRHTRKVEIRACALLLVGFVGLFGSARLDFGGVGPVGAIVVGFVCMMRWKKQQEEDGAEDGNERLTSILELVWLLLKPFLFVLIGAEIDLSKMDAKLVGLGLLVLAAGLTARMLTTFVVVAGNDLTAKERLFVTVSWLPKATVQAAIGGLALDKARRLGLSEKEQVPAMTIVTVAVLSIVLTAPLGAVLITKLGPRLLSRNNRAKMTDAPPLSDDDAGGIFPEVVGGGAGAGGREVDDYSTPL